MKTDPAPTDDPALFGDLLRVVMPAKLPEAPWLIWSHENCAWWRADFCGYTRHIGGAGRYNRIDADKICKQCGPSRTEGDPPPEVAVIAPEYADILLMHQARAARAARAALAHAQGQPGAVETECGVSGITIKPSDQ